MELNVGVIEVLIWQIQVRNASEKSPMEFKRKDGVEQR